MANPRKGRGATTNPTGRFESLVREAADDGWGSLDEPLQPLETHLIRDVSRTVIAHNRSPDVPFSRSINPYRGCEHGCIYCFARPSHAFLGYSPGLDFETRILFKPDAARLLNRELSVRAYRCETIALGANTDPYQPAERNLGITRQILEVLLAARHPVGVITKSALIERDLDLLAKMAAENLAHVNVSITTLDRTLARHLEPRAAAPERRLRTIERLSAAGIPVGLLLAPVIPALTDAELESVMATARNAGCLSAGYVLLRLPLELKDLFIEWLDVHYPLKAKRVLERVRDTRGGKFYEARFGTRMRGRGEYADLIEKRFRLAYRRLGYGELPLLDTSRFRPPQEETRQLALF